MGDKSLTVGRSRGVFNFFLRIGEEGTQTLYLWKSLKNLLIKSL